MLSLVVLVACGDDSAPRIESQAPVEETGEAPAGRSARQTLAFDQDDGRIGWSARKVTMSHEGGFRTFSGTIELDPEDVTRSTVSVDIVTDSIFADQDRLTTH